MPEAWSASVLDDSCGSDVGDELLPELTDNPGTTRGAKLSVLQIKNFSHLHGYELVQVMKNTCASSWVCTSPFAVNTTVGVLDLFTVHNSSELNSLFAHHVH